LQRGLLESGEGKMHSEMVEGMKVREDEGRGVGFNIDRMG
jgi:hypothetical protein